MLAYIVAPVTFGQDWTRRGPPRASGPVALHWTEDSEHEGAGVTDDGPKTAFELAMERLRQKDKEGGVIERPLTDAQKAAIAEARRVYDAKVAEREILHRDALRKAKSQEEVTKLGEELARDRDRFTRDRDRRINEIKESPA